jgi:hypothetical protein
MTASDKTAKSTLLGNLSASPQRVKPSAKSASWRTTKGIAFRAAPVRVRFGVSNLPYCSHNGRSEAVSNEIWVEVKLIWTPVGMRLTGKD